MEDKKLNEEPT